MKKNILKNIVISISLITSITLTGTTMTFAATLPSKNNNVASKFQVVSSKLYNNYSNFSYGVITNLSKDYVLNLRQGPGVNQSIIGKIPNGTKVKMISTNNKKWYKVQYNGKTGYVNSYYITLASDSNTMLYNSL